MKEACLSQLATKTLHVKLLLHSNHSVRVISLPLCSQFTFPPLFDIKHYRKTLQKNSKRTFQFPHYQFSLVQSLSHVRLFAAPWTTAHRASLSITNSQSLLKLMPIESVMPSSHLILCRPLLLLSPIPPSIRVFSNESTLCMRWPKYWSFSFSINEADWKHQLPMNTQDWSPLGWTGWISLQSKGLSRVFFNTTVQKHQVFRAQVSL